MIDAGCKKFEDTSSYRKVTQRLFAKVRKVIKKIYNEKNVTEKCD